MRAMVLRGPNLPFEKAAVPIRRPAPARRWRASSPAAPGLTIQHVKAGRRKVQFPRIIGHEITGEIVEVGAGVAGLKVGDPVTTYFYLNCGHCRCCLRNLEPLCENSGGQVGLECDGAYAEYIKLPAHELHQAAGRPRLQEASRRDRRRHRRAGDALQGAAPRRRQGRRDRGGDRRRRRARHPSIDDGEMGARARDRGRHQAGEIRRLPQGRRRRGGRCQRRPRGRAAAGSDRRAGRRRGGRLRLRHRDAGSRRQGARPARPAGHARAARAQAVPGAGAPTCSTRSRSILGSRYVTRSEVLESLDLVARGEVFPLVTVLRPLEEAEAVHELVERGEVIGRAALRVA